MSKRKIYWICQVTGWSFYGFLQLFLYATTTQALGTTQVVGELLQVIFYIFSTHLLRYILIRSGWLTFPFLRLVPRLLAVILVFSILNYAFIVGYSFVSGELTSRDLRTFNVILNIAGPMIMYILWTMVYFTFYYFERYDKSLKYEAAAKEIELRNLRSQLNPHFIFNSLTSIRALVDEDPRRSKNAITHLSNILRNSLMLDRQRLIPFSEEINTVKDYLSLESIRYEERLQTNFDLDSDTGRYLIPPLMVQTLVENGIKHGIATLKEGGTIGIKSRIVDNQLCIQIRNSGQYQNGHGGGSPGIGIINTKKRLELIYGDRADFAIKNENQMTVLTEIRLPVSV